MSRIEVLFMHGRSMKFDVNEVSFLDGDTAFDFRDAPNEDGEEKRLSELIKHRTIINWRAVCFVQAVRDRKDEDD